MGDAICPGLTAQGMKQQIQQIQYFTQQGDYLAYTPQNPFIPLCSILVCGGKKSTTSGITLPKNPCQYAAFVCYNSQTNQQVFQAPTGNKQTWNIGGNGCGMLEPGVLICVNMATSGEGSAGKVGVVNAKDTSIIEFLTQRGTQVALRREMFQVCGSCLAALRIRS
jgi:hypothetical protein